MASGPEIVRLGFFIDDSGYPLAGQWQISPKGKTDDGERFSEPNTDWVMQAVKKIAKQNKTEPLSGCEALQH